ncbi:ATP-binding cassette domain-containing protein [Thermicanus aegyptius]|uniref:ATP-binding cassette domain-containing protein n=1 Tax=Thermicanus aegyptius TaxID=94009 RepID=UPI0004128080|nr:ABC transporter ATP-binding protein [Thermicanus aegyptius]
MGDLPLEVENLNAGYEGKAKVRRLDFQLKEGEIVGLIGLNGAGKSTTMKTILGLLPKMGGSIRFWGMTMEEEPLQVKRRIAYIPEMPLLYDELTLWEHLQWVAMAYGLDQAAFEARVGPLLTQFRMEGVKHHFPSSFSKGMRQKVMVLFAFLMLPIILVSGIAFFQSLPLYVLPLVWLGGYLFTDRLLIWKLRWM